MSIIAEAEATVETVTGTRWVHVALKLAPWIAIAVLAIALQLTRQTLAVARADHKAELARIDAASARATAANADRLAKAADTYAKRTAALQPLIVRSTNEVTRYAETPAGHVLCRDAERVRSIDLLDSTLRAPDPAGGSEGAVHGDAPAPPAGR